ncbi:C4-dicarboxylate ABC transporter substrate-binding protein [Roseovarius sp. SCSIO 43702]|uniref:C4-dicarboxylate ABC transporter substrate-binding protein n=1 Tax=Roseovarius sp. SCSIO 43702 TaxID=2823043 RepID=UPI001C7305A0|nr:C4-dicarboxylate ABC transporter substrate-binding protein [Roseovarius sp. SCSIO 43702]QYX57672.1 C4-dicarboxylate ABC transporter substrate-binding protein [Roseovarius sp. SCSIO 43702]
MKFSIAIGAALAGALSLGSLASAETIRASSSFGPDHPLALSIYPEISSRLSEFTDGAWEIEDTPEGVAAPNEMIDALRDGTVDFGPVVVPYFPENYAEASLPSELSVLGSNSLAISSATTEYLATCAECLAEFAEHGQVYLGSDATPLYNLLTVKPVRTAEDLGGMRIRVGAPIFAAFVSNLRGVVVQQPSSEFSDALRRGVVAGSFGGDQEIIAGNVQDQVRFVTNIGLGVYNGNAAAMASRALWDRMSAEDRAALARAAQYGIAKGIGEFDAQAEDARTTEGIEFIEMDETLKEAKRTFIADHLRRASETLERRGVENAQVKAYRYALLVGKWEGLIGDDMTAEDVGQLRYDEIFGKLDMTAYGQ